jgi:hypothetical protein
MRIFVALVAVLVCSCAAAGEVFKCKAADGGVTFTNIKCPEKSSVQHYGSYTAVADDPQKPAPADDIGSAPIPTAPSRRPRIQKETDFDRIAREKDELQKSSLRRKKSEEYEASLEKWGPRMAGQPPDGYIPKTKRQVAVDSDDTPPISGTTMAVHERPRTTDCSQSSGSITCYHTDGSISSGSANPVTGSATLFNTDGTTERVSRNPAGKSATEDGTCVKDIYGQCQ